MHVDGSSPVGWARSKKPMAEDGLSDRQIAGNIIVARLKVPVGLAGDRRAYRSPANSAIFALTFATPHAVRAR
jgi:hypothetical protein